MSHSPSTASYSSNSQLQTVFVTSLKEYEEKTKKNLLTHPLMSQLQACSSPTDILAVLRNQVQHFEQSTTGGFLLDRGVNAIAEDKDRWTLLHLTPSEGQTETVRLLLDRGVSADSISKDGRTDPVTPSVILRRGRYRALAARPRRECRREGQREKDSIRAGIRVTKNPDSTDVDRAWCERRGRAKSDTGALSYHALVLTCFDDVNPNQSCCATDNRVEYEPLGHLH